MSAQLPPYREVDEVFPDTEHCSSCHSDYEDGYADFDTIVYRLPSGEWAHTYDSCCGVLRFFDANGVEWEDAADWEGEKQ